MSCPLYRVVLFLFEGPNGKSGNGQCCDSGDVTGVGREPRNQSRFGLGDDIRNRREWVGLEVIVDGA